MTFTALPKEIILVILSNLNLRQFMDTRRLSKQIKQIVDENAKQVITAFIEADKNYNQPQFEGARPREIVIHKWDEIGSDTKNSYYQIIRTTRDPNYVYIPLLPSPTPAYTVDDSTIVEVSPIGKVSFKDKTDLKKGVLNNPLPNKKMGDFLPLTEVNISMLKLIR